MCIRKRVIYTYKYTILNVLYIVERSENCTQQTKGVVKGFHMDLNRFVCLFVFVAVQFYPISPQFINLIITKQQLETLLSRSLIFLENSSSLSYIFPFLYIAAQIYIQNTYIGLYGAILRNPTQFNYFKICKY